MEWISVKDRLPETDLINVVVHNESHGVQIWNCYYRKSDQIFRWDNPSVRDSPPINVTHWIVLPEIPFLKNR